MKQAHWHTSIFPGLQRAIRESTSSRLGLCREVVFQEREKEEEREWDRKKKQANSSVAVRYRRALSLYQVGFIEESHIVVPTHAVLKRDSLQRRRCQVTSDKSQRFLRN